MKWQIASEKNPKINTHYFVLLKGINQHFIATYWPDTEGNPRWLDAGLDKDITSEVAYWLDGELPPSIKI